MKTFDQILFDVNECERQLATFREMLRTTRLKERDEILPFFRKNKQLAAFMAGRFPNLLRQDRIALDYQLFGDFVCDIVVGNSHAATYCFVELENAMPTSIFKKAGKKATPEWAVRFEHGFSQLVDWFWKLDELRDTGDFLDRFGAAQVTVHGLLVVG